MLLLSSNEYCHHITNVCSFVESLSHWNGGITDKQLQQKHAAAKACLTVPHLRMPCSDWCSHFVERVWIAVCYVLCAVSICVMIYYMDGIQDAVDSTVASIFIYAFDAAALSYFMSFPVITCLYRHPAAVSTRYNDPLGCTSANHLCTFCAVVHSSSFFSSFLHNATSLSRNRPLTFQSVGRPLRLAKGLRKKYRGTNRVGAKVLVACQCGAEKE